MSCLINCNESTLSHDVEELECFGVHPAGSSDIIIYWCLDDISDISDPAQTENAISQGSALRVESIAFGSDLPTPTNGPKVTACSAASVLFTTRTMTITDYSYNQTNNELYESLGNGRKVAAILARDCSSNPNFSDTSRFYQATSGHIAFAGGLSSTNTDEEPAFFQVEGTYRGTVDIITTPSGLFD